MKSASILLNAPVSEAAAKIVAEPDSAGDAAAEGDAFGEGDGDGDVFGNGEADGVTGAGAAVAVGVAVAVAVAVTEGGAEGVALVATFLLLHPAASIVRQAIAATAKRIPPRSCIAGPSPCALGNRFIRYR